MHTCISEDKCSESLNVKRHKRLESTSNVVCQQHDVFPFLHIEEHKQEDQERCVKELHNRYILMCNDVCYVCMCNCVGLYMWHIVISGGRIAQFVSRLPLNLGTHVRIPVGA